LVIFFLAQELPPYDGGVAAVLRRDGSLSHGLPLRTAARLASRKPFKTHKRLRLAGGILGIHLFHSLLCDGQSPKPETLLTFIPHLSPSPAVIQLSEATIPPSLQKRPTAAYTSTKHLPELRENDPAASSADPTTPNIANHFGIRQSR
jgi:hypothetical protein